MSPRLPPPCGSCVVRNHCVVGRVQAEGHSGPALVVAERSFRRGDMLSREGDLPTRLGVVKVGQVLVGQQRGDAVFRPFSVAGRGFAYGYFGGDTWPNQVSVVASTSGRICEVTAENIAPRMHGAHGWGRADEWTYRRILSLFAGWANAIGQRGVLAQVAAALLLLVQEEFGRVALLPPQAALAEILGTTRESVARALAQLEARGMISKAGSRRYLVDTPRLRALVQAATNNTG